MTGGYDSVLHALSVEPRVARPGETVCIEFRTRNLGTAPSPAATVAFVLAEGLEALAGEEVAVEPVAPGELVLATVLARVRIPVEDRSELMVQAVLRLPDAELGTNRCGVVVRCRPVLDGERSGTFVEALDAETVRVRAEVANEGDGTARNVRVVVPAPLGCARLDGDGPAVLELERLDVGERTMLAFDARIVSPVAEIRADDGEVWFGEGNRCALPSRAAFVPDAALAAPRLMLMPSRRRVDVAVDLRNDGWADAHEVPVRIELPAALKVIDGSVVADGVPVVARGRRRAGDVPVARVERSGDSMTITVSVVPARGTVRVALAAAHAPVWAGGTIGVAVEPYAVESPFVPEHVRDVRARVVETPRRAAAGELVRVAARVLNAGDVAETLTLAVAGEHVSPAGAVAARTVAAGCAGIVELAARIDEAARDGESISVDVVVSDAGGERVRSPFVLAVRDRVVHDVTETTAALDVEPKVATVRAALDAPPDVVAGSTFDVSLSIDADDAVDELVIRVPKSANAACVPGSTVVDGCRLLDRAGRSPLEDGLTLRSVPAGAHVTVAWRCLADALSCDTTVTAAAVLEVDGDLRSIMPATVNVHAGTAFALRPAGLPYHVEACAIAPAPVPAGDSAASSDGRERREAADALAAFKTVESAKILAISPAAEPAQTAALPDAGEATRRSETTAFEMLQSDRTLPSDHAPHAGDAVPDVLAFSLRLNPQRVREVEDLLRGARAGGLVSHVLALRAFFPDGTTPVDTRVDAALDDVRLALYDVFDRLFVKLRIPGFYVAADDLEDPALRRTLGALHQALAERAGGVDAFAPISDAPYGAPCVLRALAALLPASVPGDAALAAALARYASALDDALARYEGLPLELFDDALARGTDHALDEARVTVLATLRARAVPAEAAC